MDNRPEVTRAQMDETRAALAEKIETLEQRVVDTVEVATDRVGQTVDIVKDTVLGTAETARDACDIRLQVHRHPWRVMAGSIALGFLGGCLLSRRGAAEAVAGGWRLLAPPDAGARISEKHNGAAAGPRQPDALPGTHLEHVATHDGWLDAISNRLGPELAKLKLLAIGTTVSLVRDAITQSAPEPMKTGLTDVFDGIAIKLGGEPVHGRVLKAR